LKKSFIHRKLTTKQYDDIRKAMEDVNRIENEYYLDITSMEVIKVPIGRLKEAESLLYETDSEYEFGVIYDSAVRIDIELSAEQEEAIEQAINLLAKGDRYVRIPERPSQHAYECMKSFAKTLKEPLRQELLKALNGPGAFKRYKAILKKNKRVHKAWHAYNSKAMMRFIDRWLEELIS